MAGFCRIGTLRILAPTNSSKLLISVNPVRTIYSQKTRSVSAPIEKPKPWPYHTKGFNWFNSLFDKTTSRLDENSKIIVIEGPVASGKTKLAKELANELDMLYLPEANQDMLYTNHYGYNAKQLDPELPESVRSFDVTDFLLNPRHRLAATFQFRQYIAKYSQYIDALAHVLSTGQGVILDRSVYSDFIFLEAMYMKRFISPPARSIYYDVRKCTIHELLRPHLIIYLDIPVDKVIANIKQRNYSCEKQSEVLTPDYLKKMEDLYKLDFLKKQSVHSELLVYDWSDKGDVEVVVEDIERIHFDRIDDHDPKLKDWVYHLEEEWADVRHKFSDKKYELLCYLDVPRLEAPELVADAEDIHKFYELYQNAPGNYYRTGYNPTMGDNTTFLMRNKPIRDTLPHIERSLK